MKIWIVLLRGINVGGHHIVPMKELRQLLENNGLEKVATYIQSGNIVCSYPTNPSHKISTLIEQKFGFKPSTFSLTVKNLKSVVENNPYPGDGGKTVHFFFFHSSPSSVDYKTLDDVKAENEHYQLIDNVLYLYAPDGIGRSKMVDKIPKAFAKNEMTARNLNTINKLAEMVEK